MTVGECECCFGIRYLDELIRLQLVDATKNYDVLNMEPEQGPPTPSIPVRPGKT